MAKDLFGTVSIGDDEDDLFGEVVIESAEGKEERSEPKTFDELAELQQEGDIGEVTLFSEEQDADLETRRLAVEEAQKKEAERRRRMELQKELGPLGTALVSALGGTPESLDIAFGVLDQGSPMDPVGGGMFFDPMTEEAKAESREPIEYGKNAAPKHLVEMSEAAEEYPGVGGLLARLSGEVARQVPATVLGGPSALGQMLAHAATGVAGESPAVGGREEYLKQGALEGGLAGVASVPAGLGRAFGLGKAGRGSIDEAVERTALGLQDDAISLEQKLAAARSRPEPYVGGKLDRARLAEMRNEERELMGKLSEIEGKLKQTYGPSQGGTLAASEAVAEGTGLSPFSVRRAAPRPGAVGAVAREMGVPTGAFQGLAQANPRLAGMMGRGTQALLERAPSVAAAIPDMLSEDIAKPQFTSADETGFAKWAMADPSVPEGLKQQLLQRGGEKDSDYQERLAALNFTMTTGSDEASAKYTAARQRYFEDEIYEDRDIPYEEAEETE